VFSPKQNYPNPFNGETWITYQLPKGCDVRLDVFNVHGEWIVTLTAGSFPAGSYRVLWDGKRHNGEPVPSGLYMYRLVAGEHTGSRMMLYLK